jgi:hypothetical protein
MNRLLRIVACTILSLGCCSGLAFSQMGGSADKEMQQQFFDDLQTTQAELEQFGQSLQPLMLDMQKNVQAKAMAEIPKRMADSSTPMTPDMMMRFGMELAMDEMVALQPKIKEKSSEFFSEEQQQKMHLRMFQMKQGLMERLDSSDNPEVVQGAFGTEILQLMGGQPDFLELTPEQKELILKQQKETSLEAMLVTTQVNMRMLTENPEKMQQIQRLAKELQDAESDEEREEIAKKMQEINGDVMKEVGPQLKKILREGHENFMRTLTDAQRAKIKAIMADMPDYLKKRFDDFDKNGGALPGLDSWVPGMGAPGGMTNPNREAPRQRSGGRTFPE